MTGDFWEEMRQLPRWFQVWLLVVVVAFVGCFGLGVWVLVELAKLTGSMS